ncbi:Putative protein of unknown function [Podospora comata]|uniref:Uncharacterized protein n=1 Tax=Podospora comata TaxID=48703 RepID=A0ABY6SFH5_PODCO|nr:Putative protein of unknown function [Podospora comata]
MRATCLEEMTNSKVKLQRATMAHRLLDQLSQLLGQLESQRGKALEPVQGVVIGLEKADPPHSCIAKYLDEDLRQNNNSLSEELPRDKGQGSRRVRDDWGFCHTVGGGGTEAAVGSSFLAGPGV